MKPYSSWQISVLPLFALLGLFLAGCSKTNSVAQFNDTNMKRLRNCYSMYQSVHGFKGPKSEAEFKEFLKTTKVAEVRLERMGIDQGSVDDIFINERDGEPFKVRYGVNGTKNNAIVFEAVGVDGKRMVGLSPVLELEDAEYEAYWSGKKKGESFEIKEEME